ncbi:uncharacterized protein LOC131934880 isoform X2 [Physella acuta]|uniref:uncharacterized protein LOC131934880 isoform X2 n=1 Tax=Physella acuta TaxID=109671 RepID=UPI0027DB8BCE|nr:uncharacterized protein LOC131934880 isoform X2 [Physella acuta]
MPEQEINPAAAKFISSLVKSLQILCNGQVDFDESIELVGHINVRVDRKYKFDYIVDEHVSKEGEDSSTTFLSNSYHSRPPLKQLNKKPSASELEQEIMFSEIPHNTNRRLRQSKNSNNSVETHQQEENSAGADENNQNYSVSVEPMDRHGDQPNQMVVKLEEADDSNDCMVLPASPGDYEQVEGSEAFPIAGPSASYDESISVHTRRTRKRRKVNDLGNIALMDTKFRCSDNRELARQRLKKTSALFSCREYLDRYNSFCKLKNKLPDKQEMMKVFSELAQKYGVAITIKPAKYISQSVISEPSCLNLAKTNCRDTLISSNDQSIVLSKIDKVPATSTPMSKAIIIEKPSLPRSSTLSSSSVAHKLFTDSTQLLPVITSDTARTILSTHENFTSENVSFIQDCKSDISESIAVLADTLIPFQNTEISTELPLPDKIYIQDPYTENTAERHQEELVNISSRSVSCAAKLNETNLSSSSLLSAIAVTLAKEEASAEEQTSHEIFRQQPLPKHHRGSYLVRLRKEDPDRYERYRCLSKEEQARERRRISEANQDPSVIEKKSLMNRIMYLRKVGKLPHTLREKTNNEIRLIPIEDLKSLLPPTKSLRYMDPAAKEEWYRLGRSREWRRKKKLLDPEGFKRYNNERAKKYQDNLRKNNPEKFKELRAKAAERLRQYRLFKRNMKFSKHKDSKVQESSNTKNLRLRSTQETIEVTEAEEELLLEDGLVKADYMIPDCATTHGEAATRRESSSARTGQTVQQDILDLMYNY